MCDVFETAGRRAKGIKICASGVSIYNVVYIG